MKHTKPNIAGSYPIGNGDPQNDLDKPCETPGAEYSCVECAADCPQREE